MPVRSLDPRSIGHDARVVGVHDGDGPDQPPNHHAGHGRFQGFPGMLLGLGMIAGRGKDARLACDLTQLEREDCVVDIGCGPGVAARAAASKGARVTGVDPADSMLRLARLFRGGENLAYVEGTAEAIPLGDGTQTIAWSIATAHHWTSVEQGIAEIRRVLRPGGRLLVLERLTTPSAKGLRSHGWTPEQARAFAARCGDRAFRNVRVEQHRGRIEELAVLAVAA